MSDRYDAAVPVESGLVAFTEVPAGDHRGYNAWHQLDHLPEVHTVAGVVHGERWVASPRCRDAAPVAGDPFVAAHYLTLYLLAPPTAAAMEGIGRLSTELDAAGRTFADRRSVYTGVLPLAAATAAPRVGVKAAAVPFRPATGVLAVVDDPAAGLPPDLTGIDGVAGAWAFAADGGAERVTVAWLDDDPVAVARRAAPALAGVRHAAPYEAIRPGEWDWFGT